MSLSSAKIKSLRKERGWSQEHLSQVSGLSCRTVQRIEKEGSASPESLMALASAFSMSPSELQTEYKANIGNGAISFSGMIGLTLLFSAIIFYLYISGDPFGIIDVPAFLYISIIPFSISTLTNGLLRTCKVYQLLVWLVYEKKAMQGAHTHLPILRKLIIYSYASGATGVLFSLFGMLSRAYEVHYPTGFSVALLIFIYAIIQSEFLFRPLYHKLNRQLLNT
ncbi:helix-turn-helix domain-containing protein [Catenovulum sediminis]|uniref:helix-turn-helix domain-containing protein n=1 Tax=Catenovulum sediminis TaxID=1740262 RepID=UPI00117E8E69|nr:helix-turn-helix transcriptional regulator [Catenovulum sediminis]